MRVRLNGKCLVGTAVEILEGLREESFFEQNMTMDEYIEHLKASARRFHNAFITVAGDTMEDRAESILREMARIGMLKIEEEDAVGKKEG